MEFVDQQKAGLYSVVFPQRQHLRHQVSFLMCPPAVAVVLLLLLVLLSLLHELFELPSPVVVSVF